MKVTILDKAENEEDEIIIKCCALDENLLKLINSFKTRRMKMSFYKDSQIVLIDPCDIFYIESVDDNVFAYTQDGVYESKSKLYMLENELFQYDFIRANKAVIVNLNKIENLTPAFGGRFEASLSNGCKVIISRMYVAQLKDLLGL